MAETATLPNATTAPAAPAAPVMPPFAPPAPPAEPGAAELAAERAMLSRLAAGDHMDARGKFETVPVATPPPAAAPPAPPPIPVVTPPAAEVPPVVAPPPAAPAKEETVEAKEYVVDGQRVLLTEEQAHPFTQMGLKHAKLVEELKPARSIHDAISVRAKEFGPGAQEELAKVLADATAGWVQSRQARSATPGAVTAAPGNGQRPNVTLPPNVLQAVKFFEDMQSAQVQQAQQAREAAIIEGRFRDLGEFSEMIGVPLTEKDMEQVAVGCQQARAQAAKLPEGHPERDRLLALSYDPLRVGKALLAPRVKEARAALFRQGAEEAAKRAQTAEPTGAPSVMTAPAGGTALRPLDEYSDADKMKLTPDQFDKAEHLWKVKKGWAPRV